MRVLMLTNVVAPDKLGGLERYVRELSVALAADGVDVVVVAKTGRDALPGVERVGEHLTIVRYAPPSKRNPLFGVLYPIRVTAAVRRAMRTTGADRTAVRCGDVLLHGHFPVPMIAVLAARLPFVYTMHAPVFKELLGERQGTYSLPAPVQQLAVSALAALERLIVSRARRVVTLSSFMAAEAQDLAGDRALRLARITGGIDVDRFSPGERLATLGNPVLFSARRLVERTGVELLIKAMPSVLERLPGARLSIAGAGPRKDAVEGLIHGLGLEAAVTLLGRVSEEELLAWYRRADLCITPTLYLEGFGLSTAEALACGTPTVVTPAGANPELVQSLHPALLAAETTSSALADAIVATAAIPAEAALSERARASVAPAMGWPSVAAQHEALYAEIRRELHEGAVHA